MYAKTPAQVDDLRRHRNKWEKILGRSSQVIKPIFKVVAYGVPIRSIADMDKEAIIKKFKLKNCRILNNYRIIK